MLTTTAKIEFPNGNLYIGYQRSVILHRFRTNMTVEINSMSFRVEKLIDDGCAAVLKPAAPRLFDPLRWQDELATQGNTWQPRYHRTAKVKSRWQKHGQGTWSVQLPICSRADIERTLQKWCTPEQLDKLRQMRRDISEYLEQADMPVIPSPS